MTRFTANWSELNNISRSERNVKYTGENNFKKIEKKSDSGKLHEPLVSLALVAARPVVSLLLLFYIWKRFRPELGSFISYIHDV